MFVSLNFILQSKAVAMGVLKFVFVPIFLFAVSAHPNVRHANVGIVGGHNVRIHMVPFMVSLRLNGTFHWCGGSIIDKWFILTAAHCINEDREFKVLVGTDHINGGGRLYDIEKIHVHERYNTQTQDYDVGLIKLKTPLTFGSNVGKVDLPSIKMKLSRRTILNITGWGSTGVRMISPNLLQAQIPLVWKQNCQKKYAMAHRNITSRMICAGEIDHTTCQGDSGGPLTHGNVQVGVTSYGLGCGVYPGVFTRVASIVSWVNRKMNIWY